VSALDTQIGGGHYKGMKIQPMEYSMKNGLDACQHTAIKYISRFREKGGIQDLEKAKHCIDMLIEFERQRLDEVDQIGQRHEATPNVLEFDEARIDRIAASHGDGEHYAEDMTDPANWRAGDLVEVVSTENGDPLTVGDVATIAGDRVGMCIPVTMPHLPHCYFMMPKELRFHSRPSS